MSSIFDLAVSILCRHEKTTDTLTTNEEKLYESTEGSGLNDVFVVLIA